MNKHLSASLVIIALLIAGFAVFGAKGMKALFVPDGFFFVDNNPARIVIPEEGMVTGNTAGAFPGIGPVAREIGALEFSMAPKGVRFDIECAAVPAYNAVALDGEFKLHNGADVRRTISIGPKAYTLRPSTTITIAANDPGVWPIYCDGYSSGSTVQIGN